MVSGENSTIVVDLFDAYGNHVNGAVGECSSTCVYQLLCHTASAVQLTGTFEATTLHLDGVEADPSSCRVNKLSEAIGSTQQRLAVECAVAGAYALDVRVAALGKQLQPVKGSPFVRVAAERQLFLFWLNNLYICRASLCFHRPLSMPVLPQ